MLFFELLQISLGNREKLSRVPTRTEWITLYEESEKQSILGVMLGGIERLPEELRPPRDILLQWIGVVRIIEDNNKLVNRRCSELASIISNAGYRCCLLKGQGNAVMYPTPYRRTPGDIDIWIEGGKEKIIKFVHKLFPQVSIQYHHMDFPIFEDVEVEVHYLPSFCYNKIHNKRLQQYFAKKSIAQFDNYVIIDGTTISVPTVSFNLVFQLSHMMRHFFTQGIGLRHAIDFYYLLCQNVNDDEMCEAISVMKHCGMYRFMCAMLFIEQKFLGLRHNLSLATPDEKAGNLVLNEMIKGGNFGKYFFHNKGDALWMFAKQMTYRLRYLTVFPSEPLWRPVAHIWDHFENKYIWKKI